MIAYLSTSLENNVLHAEREAEKRIIFEERLSGNRWTGELGLDDRSVNCLQPVYLGRETDTIIPSPLSDLSHQDPFSENLYLTFFVNQ
jgi:hypothetical protein